jgi:hypothetical protein
MTADRFVSLFHESFSDAPMERIGFYSCNDVCLLYRLVDYKFIEMRCIRVLVYKNRNDRILRQIACRGRFLIEFISNGTSEISLPATPMSCWQQ